MIALLITTGLISACNGTEWWCVWVVAFVASTWPWYTNLLSTLPCVGKRNLLVGGKK